MKRLSPSTSMQLAVVVPTYNEAASIAPLVKRITTSLRNNHIEHHIYVIDDHSSDKTQSIVEELAQTLPVTLLIKQGKQGKGYSILEAANQVSATYIAMIDADLQYPPEALPDMFRLTQQFGVVVARRNNYQDSKLRRFISQGFQRIFGKLLYNLDCDVQSGLKIFKREIITNVDEKDISPWTLDIPLLTTALNLGFTIGEVQITFQKRQSGTSKVRLFSSIREIGSQAITFRFKRRQPFKISPQEKDSMLGAGIIHRGRRFVTHTTLQPNHSALEVTTPPQQAALIGLLGLLIVAISVGPMTSAIGVVAVLTTIYFTDMCFNFYVILRSLQKPPEIAIDPQEIAALKDRDLPIYTVLCPLYKEAHVLPQFFAAIERIDWPKSKLDVILLLESDDIETIEVAKNLKLPPYISVQIVPDSQPKTKPKACNYGLHFAKGEYLVIYDAEDAPDPLQLKKVFIGFKKAASSVKCIQAKLNFYNPYQNLLTRFFTAEYSLWFDVVLTGLQSIQTSLPLGGTSNHFRTTELKQLEGWDPFNVTEDADLGIRLFKRGATTAMIDSVTLEEANSSWGNWLRQRSRWIKGYMQTYLVHMRHPITFFREYGWHAFIFQLIMGSKISFMMINPIMWLLTISYFGLYAWLGPSIEALYPSVIFYMAVSSLIFGNFIFVYYYMIGAAKREHWGVVKWVLLIPIYWLMVSVAATIALYQLIVKPHYWEKTIHGLHLKKKKAEKVAKSAVTQLATQVMTEAVVQQKAAPQKTFLFTGEKLQIFRKLHLNTNSYKALKETTNKLLFGEYRGGFWLVVATISANFLNMATSLFLGDELSLANFAIINTFVSLLYLVGIPSSALSATINHRTALLLGKFKLQSAKKFWTHVQKRAIIVSIIATAAWLSLIPWLTEFFNLPNVLPLLFFTPLLITGILGAVNEGYLRGKLWFEVLAITSFIDPLLRLLLSIGFDFINLDDYLYVPIVIAGVTASLIGAWYARQGDAGIDQIKEFRLQPSFFGTALVSRLSAIAFFSLDNVIVAHYLTAKETGMYGILGLIGKMIFFAGSLSAGFILPLVSHKEGKNEASGQVFKKLFTITLLLSLAAYLVFGIALPLISPYILGEKVNAIRNYLPIYGVGILFYTISQTVVQYRLARRDYFFSYASFFVALLQVIGLMIFHNSLSQVVLVMYLSGISNALVQFVLNKWYHKIKAPLQNVQDLFDLFQPWPKLQNNLKQREQYRILILNWRDVKHQWAGGAEKYMFEIAKRLVKHGKKVTVFCGNDGKQPRNEVIDGVQIIRRGGFYTVYFWAFVYYVFRLRHYTDIVIDCENGIPFLTPVYVKKPIILLIHHIHQEVFMKHLRFPASEIAALIESDVMPFFYKNQNLVTVSESSRTDMINLGLGTQDTIDVVNPGIDNDLFNRSPKTKNPSFLYVGRLKPYKKVDIAIKAFSQVVKQYPKAQLTIAGKGETLEDLTRLVKELNLVDHVTFKTNVSDKDKAKLYSESWVTLQPSIIEGWGITVIESNASGTPVIASNVKGLRDSVVQGETGILVTPEHISHLAEAMTTLIKNKPLRDKLSLQAKKWSKQFDWEMSFEKFDSLLEQKIVKHAKSTNPELATLKV